MAGMAAINNNQYSYIGPHFTINGTGLTSGFNNITWTTAALPKKIRKHRFLVVEDSLGEEVKVRWRRDSKTLDMYHVMVHTRPKGTVQPDPEGGWSAHPIGRVQVRGFGSRRLATQHVLRELNYDYRLETR